MNKKNKVPVSRKQPTYNTPNLSKMQEVIIDARTRIYVALDEDPEVARKRYLARLEAR